VERLSSEIAAARLVDDGPNVLQQKAKITASGLFLNWFKSPSITPVIAQHLVMEKSTYC
jgi:hypothetical protein